jgi:thiamine-triphosphatase
VQHRSVASGLGRLRPWAAASSLGCRRRFGAQAAEAEIERVASLIDAQPLDTASGGKLETYIRRFCPDVLAQLLEAGVLTE